MLLSAQHGHLYSTQPTASLSRVLAKTMLPDTGETVCLASVRQRHVVDPAHESERDSLPISRCCMNGMIFPLWGFRCSIALYTPPRWGNHSRHISSMSQLLTNTPRFNQQIWLRWMLDTHGHVRCPRTGNIIHEACLNSSESHILPHTHFLARSVISTVYYLANQPAMLRLSFTLATCVGWKKKEKLKQVTVVLPCITCQRKVIVCQNLAYVLHFADRKGTVECDVTLVMVAWQYCL